MATIRIDDGPHPRRTEVAGDDNPGVSIYDMRPLNRTQTTLSEDGVANIRSHRQYSFSSRRFSFASKDGTVEDEDADLRRESDYKHKQVRTKSHGIFFHD